MILQGGGERTFAAYDLFVRMGSLIRRRTSIQTHVHSRVFDEIFEVRVASSHGQAKPRGVKQKMGGYALCKAVRCRADNTTGRPRSSRIVPKATELRLVPLASLSVCRALQIQPIARVATFAGPVERTQFHQVLQVPCCSCP